MADALIVNGAAPNGRFGTAPKAIAWPVGLETMV